MDEEDTDSADMPLRVAAGRAWVRWMQRKLVKIRIREAFFLTDTEVLKTIARSGPESRQEIAKRLTHRDARIRRLAIDSLADAAQEGADISPLIPDLLKVEIEVEMDESQWYRGENLRLWAVVKAMQCMARNGYDVSDAAGRLHRELGSADNAIQLAAAQALAYYYWNRGMQEELCRLFDRDLWWISSSAAGVMEEGVRNGRSLTDTLPAVVHMFKSRNWIIQEAGTGALRALDSLERLREMETGLEQWFSRQSETQQNQEGRVRTQVAVVRALQVLAERKVELAKQNDGELLTGETIRLPSRNRGIYRQGVRVS